MISEKKSLISRFRNPIAVLTHDLCMIPLAWMVAYWLRFNLGPIPELFLKPALEWLPAVLLVQGSAFYFFGLYRGHWRFASVQDLFRIIKAVISGAVISLAIIFLFTRLESIPRSVFVLYPILLVMFLAAPRLLYRWIKDHRVYLGSGKRVLIVGAGQAGEMLVRDIFSSGEGQFHPVAFIDDNRRKTGLEIHGVRVVGTFEDLPAIVDRMSIELVLFAIPSAKSSVVRRVVELCESAEVPFRTLPKIADLMSGKVDISSLREVSIEDLLGRDPVKLDREALHQGLSGKRILVTGGGGSIGSELCRQIARLGPSKLIVFDQSEFNLFEIDRELRKYFPALQIETVLGDVTSTETVERVFALHHPDVVFHAAAYKHVPMLENQAREAANNNILGTRQVALSADQHGAEIFVLVSTDKAVNPTNIMGATKRSAEIFCQDLDKRSRTKFITVRFGNVLGSAGSVVPLFQEQIRKGGPVTVTHPKITRYFMTIPEASQLIMQAGVMGKGGEIFVLDMGEPVSITYLAEQMIHLSGLEPGEDIEITYTGLRPGEKLYEELFHEKESLVTTGHEKILLARHRSGDSDKLKQIFDRLKTACSSFDEESVRNEIKQLVPELHEAADTSPDNVIPFDQRNKA